MAAGELIVMLVETLSRGMPCQQHLHVFEGRYRHAALTELTQGFGGVGVVAHQGGQVVGDRETRLPLLEQVLEAGVGLFGGAEAGEHAHGPQAAAMQGGVHPARVGILAGEAQVGQVVEVGEVEGGVQPLDGFGGGGDEARLALRHGGKGILQVVLLPLLQRPSQLVLSLAGSIMAACLLHSPAPRYGSGN